MSRLATQEMLSFLGCRVEAAPDGLEAFAHYEASEFDLIILDISMPGLDGFETARRIRSSQKPGSQNIPIVAMTGHDDPEQQNAHRAAGTNDLLLKPATLSALSEILERWLSSPCEKPSERQGGYPPSADDAEAEGLYLPPLLELAALQGPGESDIIQELANIFLKEMPSRLSVLSQALGEKDFLRLEEAVHTIKGSCGVISALRMAALCEIIEESTKEKENHAIERHIRSLHEEYTRVEKQLAAKPWKTARPDIPCGAARRPDTRA